MTDNIIILDIVVSQAPESTESQLCNDLSNTYFSTSASANNEYTFAWGPNGGLSGIIKIAVGNAEFMVNYNGSTQKVEIIGVCSGTYLSRFSIDGQSAVYNYNNHSFTVYFYLIDGASIEITVAPGNNTTIRASSEGFGA